MDVRRIIVENKEEQRRIRLTHDEAHLGTNCFEY